MREYRILTKIQLLSLFSINKARHSNNEDEKKKSRKNILLLIVMVVLLGNMSFTYSFMLADAIPGPEAMSNMLLLIAAATSLFLIMVSILSAKGILFSFGDFDMIMSWPAPRMSVVLSRLTTLYAYNLFYGLLFLIPAGVVFAIYQTPGWTFYPVFLLLSLFIPAVPTALGALLGTLITFLTAGMKKRAMLSTALQMLLFAGIMLFSFSMNKLMPDIGKWTVSLRSAALRFYPPLVFYVDACASGALLPALLFVAVSAAACAVSAIIVSKSFMKLSSRLIASPVSASGSGRLRFQKGRAGTLKALFINEWKRYINCSVYVMNTAFGTLLLVLLAVAIAVKRADVLSFLLDFGSEAAGLLLPFVLSFLVAMSATTGSSVSIEGKRLWIVQSLPAPVRDWMLAKVLLSLSVVLPGILIAGAAAAILLPLSALDTLYLFLLPTAYALFMAVWGLAVNLRFPKLDWKSETQVVKQSLPAMICVFSSMVFVTLPAVLVIFVQGRWALPLVALILLAAALLLFMRISKNDWNTMKKLEA